MLALLVGEIDIEINRTDGIYKKEIGAIFFLLLQMKISIISLL